MSTTNSEPPAAGWGFLAPDTIRDPNSHPHTGVTATFRDGSQVTLAHLGVDTEGRQRYAYALTDETGRVVEAGDDLRSGVGDPVDHSKMLAAWTGFAGADADTYRSAMDGNPAQEWAYQHDDELSALSCELEFDPDSDTATAACRSSALARTAAARTTNSSPPSSRRTLPAMTTWTGREWLWQTRTVATRLTPWSTSSPKRSLRPLMRR